jgi:menaquinone-dependent protoporphyrinogen oxidase
LFNRPCRAPSPPAGALVVRGACGRGDPAPDAHDVVVLGSGVYAGHWLKQARDYVDAHQATLQERSVWLFSSGPVGDPPEPLEDPADLPELLDKTQARGHQLFAGKVDRSRVRFAERAILAALRVPDGDFRDMEAVRAWALSLLAAEGESPAAATSGTG